MHERWVAYTLAGSQSPPTFHVNMAHVVGIAVRQNGSTLRLSNGHEIAVKEPPSHFLPKS